MFFFIESCFIYLGFFLENDYFIIVRDKVGLLNFGCFCFFLIFYLYNKFMMIGVINYCFYEGVIIFNFY